MKKFAICCLALVVAAMFAPAAQAQAITCYHLTNFCDGVQVATFVVGGIQKTEVVGLWDWVCLGAGTGSLMSGGTNAFGTQPQYPFGFGPEAGFNANFKFGSVLGVGKEFDLYATTDGMTTFAFQTAQPWTKTKGPCNPLTPAQKAMPRATLVQ